MIVGWFWCRVYGISCGLNWEDIFVGGQRLFWDDFESKTGVYRSCQGALWHTGAWKARCGVAGASSGTPGRGRHAVAWLGCILWHAGVWNPRCSVAGCILGYATVWDSTL